MPDDLGVAYIASQELVKVSSLLPANKQRSALVHSLVSAFGLLNSESKTRKLRVVNPRRATFRELEAYHTKEYLDVVLDPSRLDSQDTVTRSIAELGLEDDCPPFAGLEDYVPLVAGASLTATNALKVAEVAICWDGGRHHAQKSKASGFCYVADCILSILSLKKFPPILQPVANRKSRIMYLDLDLHFSDAVSQAFHSTSVAHTSQVLTLSIHHAAPGFFPSTPLADLPSPAEAFDPFTLSIPLLQGASSKTYRRIWPLVEEIRTTFQPDYVIVQCGVDALAGDPCGIFNWSLGDGEGSLGWCVDRVVNLWPGKTLLLGGGGYNHPNAARAWTWLTSIAANRNLSLDAQIPDHSAFPAYGPSFTLDVPAGNMQDRNTDQYLATVSERVAFAITALQGRLRPT